MRKPPMTAAEAAEIISEMKEKTSIKSQIALIRHALGPIGNLSNAAKSIYSDRLAELNQ